MFYFRPHCITRMQTVSNIYPHDKKSQQGALCYNISMNLHDTSEVILALRERLEPVEPARTLIDEIEGVLPNARRSAVLLGLFEQNEETYLAFIRRATTSTLR